MLKQAHMIQYANRTLQTASVWQLTILSIIGSEVITAALSTTVELLGRGSVSLEILGVGAIDSFVAAALVAPVLIHLVRDAAQLANRNKALLHEIAARRDVEEQLRESENRFRTFVEHSSEWIVMTDEQGIVVEWNRGAEEITGLSREAIVGLPIWETQYRLVAPVQKSPAVYERIRATLSNALQTGSSPIMNRVVEAQFFRADGAVRVAEQRLFPIRTPKGFRLSGISRDITERKQSEAEIQRRLAELEAVNQLSTAMRTAQTMQDMLAVVLETTLKIMQARSGAIWWYHAAAQELRPMLTRGLRAQSEIDRLPPEKPGEGIAGYVFETGQAYLTREYHSDPVLPDTVRQKIPPGIGGAAVPIRAADSRLGVLDIHVALPRELTQDQVRLLTILSEIAGNAIQRATLHEQTEQRLRHLTALSDIDSAIISGFDLTSNLKVLLGHVIEQLDVHAADVLLFDNNSQVLEYAAGVGFRRPTPQRTRWPLGQDSASRAVLERRTIHGLNLTDYQAGASRVDSYADEGFVSGYAVPLLAKDQVNGVLEVFHRLALEPDQEWHDFLHALARQCAIAIDNATLFSSLQRSNMDLAHAHDATIEGWSRALDLRDKETEGHTQRVTELTVRLAKAAGFSEEELIHIRRGALLHDIGKMGIPDHVLLKPDKLTDEEWEVMRQHPAFAFELLSPIAYLRPALDIPFCHHEKWDGTGYPRGLVGEAIPLDARIFAVADVWDALSSDRPYRPAWDADRVCEYIRAQSGSHFDPHAVDLFFQVVCDKRG
jgi:PAS domain S-box-containing protein